MGLKVLMQRHLLLHSPLLLDRVGEGTRCKVDIGPLHPRAVTQARSGVVGNKDQAHPLALGGCQQDAHLCRGKDTTLDGVARGQFHRIGGITGK